MTATRTRRVVPLLIVTLLAGGGASLSSNAFAAPTTTTANVTTDTDNTVSSSAGGNEVATYLTDSPRTIKHIAKKPRPVKKLIRTVDQYGVGARKEGVIQGAGGDAGSDGTRFVPKYPTTPCVNLDCL
ncbi:hypothetical protein AB0D29_31755 [Streptomyces sp. NPDC048424]|uniref:hypothetical protein n=1 Tax=Streptomyces sp. NPDC048424 TaxID=3155265 RepID=UPI00341C284C